jgi:hypothetical protein
MSMQMPEKTTRRYLGYAKLTAISVVVGFNLASPKIILCLPYVGCASGEPAAGTLTLVHIWWAANENPLRWF